MTSLELEQGCEAVEVNRSRRPGNVCTGRTGVSAQSLAENNQQQNNYHQQSA